MMAMTQGDRQEVKLILGETLREYGVVDDKRCAERQAAQFLRIKLWVLGSAFTVLLGLLTSTYYITMIIRNNAHVIQKPLRTAQAEPRVSGYPSY